MKSMEVFLVSIVPVPKPRMTQRDKWLNPPRPCVEQYRTFKDELNLKLNQLKYNFELPDKFDIIFHMPCPKSWSKKKRAEMDGQPHQQMPDRDNLMKAFQDALLQSDAHIYDGRVGKYWTDGDGYIEVRYEPT